MREIKFRGKRIDNGEWVYGYYAKANEGEEGIKHVIQAVNSYEYVNGDTIGEYTGLKDRSGKEIYEGDILDLSCEYDAERKGIIEFLDGSFIVRNAKRKFNYESLKDILKAYDEAIVLGNIYENKEILNENQKV